MYSDFSSEEKIENFIGKFLIFFLFLLKTYIVGTLISTQNLCFGAKLRKIGIPLHTPVFLYKSGVQWGYTLHGHVFVMIGMCYG